MDQSPFRLDLRPPTATLTITADCHTARCRRAATVCGGTVFTSPGDQVDRVVQRSLPLAFYLLLGIYILLAIPLSAAIIDTPHALLLFAGSRISRAISVR